MNQSVHFKQMGWDASFVGAVGNDEPGKMLLRALRAYDVNCAAARVIEGKTAGNTLRVDRLGERFEAPGGWQGGVYETYRLSDSDWVHLTKSDLWVTHANHTDFAEARKRKSLSQIMAVDFLHLTDYDLLSQSFPAANIAFFGGTPDMEGPLSEIAAAREALIVLTLGADGSIAFHGKNIYRQPALPLEKVVDTTGCGDAFQAGFTDAYHRFGDVPRALTAGAVRAQSTATRFGALPWPAEMSAVSKQLYNDSDS